MFKFLVAALMVVIGFALAFSESIGGSEKTARALIGAMWITGGLCFPRIANGNERGK